MSMVLEASPRLDVLSVSAEIDHTVMSENVPPEALGLSRDEWARIVRSVLDSAKMESLVLDRIEAESRADRAERRTAYWERAASARANEREKLAAAICDALEQMGPWGSPRALDDIRRTLTVAVNEVDL